MTTLLEDRLAARLSAHCVHGMKPEDAELLAEYDRARQQPAQESTQPGVSSAAGDGFRVEVSEPECSHCQRAAAFDVVGPDGVATGTTYGDECDAEEQATALNAAYELGRSTPRAEPQPAQGGAGGTHTADGRSLLDVYREEVKADDALREVWRDAGGKFHGPNVETGTMPEAQLLPFLRKLILDGYSQGVKRATPAPAPVERVTGLDDHPMRDRFAEAIMGALMFGYQQTNKAPEGHWLEQFWNFGNEASRARTQQEAQLVQGVEPIPMVLHCPECFLPHVDDGDWATRVHRTHRCSNCRYEWRPSNVPTVGVAALASPPNAAQDCTPQKYHATGSVLPGCDPADHPTLYQVDGIPPEGFPIHAVLYHDGEKVAEGMVNTSCAAQDIRSLQGSPRPPTTE